MTAAGDSTTPRTCGNKCYAAGALIGGPKVVVGFQGCGGGNPLSDTSSDGKTLEQCIKSAVGLKAGMVTYNTPNQHCIAYTAEQCRTTAERWSSSTYTLYDVSAGMSEAEMSSMVVSPGQYFSGSCKDVTTCSKDEAQSRLPTATTDRVCVKKDLVVYEWTYHKGARDAITGMYKSWMVNQLGTTIDCVYGLEQGYNHLYVNQGLYGRVSFLNLPSDINTLYVNGSPPHRNDIHEIVSVQGVRKHHGDIERFYIHTYDQRRCSVGGCNLNLAIKCPKGTHSYPIAGLGGGEFWGIRGFHKTIRCTYP
jgi:hypothetical protein